MANVHEPHFAVDLYYYENCDMALEQLENSFDIKFCSFGASPRRGWRHVLYVTEKMYLAGKAHV